MSWERKICLAGISVNGTIAAWLGTESSRDSHLDGDCTPPCFSGTARLGHCFPHEVHILDADSLPESCFANTAGERPFFICLERALSTATKWNLKHFLGNHFLAFEDQKHSPL